MHLWSEYGKAAPNWLQVLEDYIPKPTYPRDRDAIIQLISVIASVTGVILALFYPILATIASTAYAKVHANIRDLLLYEEQTQSYLRRLTYLTACSIMVLLFLSFGFLPGNLVLLFLAFYCFITLFGILKIGLGIYNFFEPSTLSRIVLSKLSETLSNVTTDGSNSMDKSFQEHYYKMALQQTENLAIITSLCLKDDDLKETSFKKSMRSSIEALSMYLDLKLKIPVDSEWYPEVYSHVSYFESEQSNRDLSKSTNTYVQPKKIQDLYWFEERIVDNISLGIETIVKSGHIKVLFEIIPMTYPVVARLSHNMSLKTTFLIFQKIMPNILALSEGKENSNEYDDWKYQLACIEKYSYGLLGAQVGIFERIGQFDSNKIRSEYNKINWNVRRSIYKTDFTEETYKTLSKFYDYIKNELIVEGERLTPDWFFLQYLTAEYLLNICERIDEALSLFEQYFLPVIDHFSKQKRYLLSSFTAHIGLEITHKLNYRMGEILPIIDDLDSLETCTGEFKWSKPNKEEIFSKIESFERRCVEVISDDLEELSRVKWKRDYPDIFGHSYSIISKYLNLSFETNDHEQFAKYFPTFLKSSHEGYEGLNETFKHFTNQFDISYQTLIDSMEISGYAYLYSGIYNDNRYWNTVKEAWDQLFLASESNITILIAMYVHYTASLYSTGINYNEKHIRENGFSTTVKRLNIDPQQVTDVFLRSFVEDVDSFSSHDPAELFMEMYLFTFLTAQKAQTMVKRNLFHLWGK